MMNTDQPTDYSSIDGLHVSRRRKPNFTDHEVLNIIDQYDLYKELLHSREASKSVIAQKQAIWKKITENLNAAYPQVERTVEDVRRKWKKLQSEAKREVAAYRAAQQAGTVTPVSNRQMSFYHRILSICRAPNPSSSVTHFSLPSGAIATLPSNNGHPTDRIDSPRSESPCDENGSVGAPDERSNSSPPATILPSVISNGQISKRTLEKQRKQIKAARVQPAMTMKTASAADLHSLRHESLAKRRRTLELTCQKLLCDKECLLLEQKNIELRLAMNECEHERIQMEKRRLDVVLQKYSSASSMVNGNSNANPSHLSDVEDQEDNQSLDEISDIND